MKKPANTGRVKKTLMLDESTAGILEGMSAVSGKDQSEIISSAIIGVAPMRNMLCFVMRPGLSPVAELLDNYQARPHMMSYDRTELLCDLVLSFLGSGICSFYSWSEQKDGLNTYIASRITKKAMDVPGSSFKNLHDKAVSGSFLSDDPAESESNLRSFVNNVKSFCTLPEIEHDDFLIRVMVASIRDGMTPVDDMEKLRGVYRMASKHGIELM